jgi:hypothetical protein
MQRSSDLDQGISRLLAERVEQIYMESAPITDLSDDRKIEIFFSGNRVNQDLRSFGVKPST